MPKHSDHSSKVASLVALQEAHAKAQAEQHANALLQNHRLFDAIVQRLEVFRSSIPFTTEVVGDAGFRAVIFRPHDATLAVEKEGFLGFMFRKREVVSYCSTEFFITRSEEEKFYRIRVSHGKKIIGYYDQWAGKSRDGITFPPEPTTLDDLIDVLSYFVARAKYQLENSKQKPR